jgi:thiamine biosynthesis lipoprotein
MATSGNYRNFYKYNGKSYSHIIDPRNGKSVESSLLSVTVLAESCMDADALATALSILSYDEGFKLINSIEGSEALWILSNELNDFIVKKTDNMPFFN